MPCAAYEFLSGSCSSPLFRSTLSLIIISLALISMLFLAQMAARLFSSQMIRCLTNCKHTLFNEFPDRIHTAHLSLVFLTTATLPFSLALLANCLILIMMTMNPLLLLLFLILFYPILVFMGY